MARESLIPSPRRGRDQVKTSEQYISRYLLAHFEKVSNIHRDLKRLPSAGEAFYLHTDKSFNGFTFIAFVAKFHRIKKMYACTYSLSVKVIEAFIEMIDKGDIEQLVLVISDSMLKRNPKSMDRLKALTAGRGNVTVQFAWSHAKVTLMETDGGHFVVEGSGNFSENASVEQYHFVNDLKVYRFRESMFNEIEIRHEF